MEIITTTQNAITIMQVHGNIDSSTYQIFQSKAEALIADGARYILVDMTHAPYISSAGLRAMHAIFNNLRGIHKDANDETLRVAMSTGAYKSPYFKVCCLSPESREVFELGGFDTYIEVYNDVATAIATFN